MINHWPRKVQRLRVKAAMKFHPDNPGPFHIAIAAIIAAQLIAIAWMIFLR
jgi:hypothetical protein